MHVYKLLHKFGRGSTVAHFPAGDMKGLPERSTYKTSGSQIIESRNTLVFLSIENDMFIEFIAAQNSSNSAFRSVIVRCPCIEIQLKKAKSNKNIECIFFMLFTAIDNKTDS